MHTSVKNYFIKLNEPIEGRVPYMYLDIKGLVTIGIGNIIDVENGSLDKILDEVKKLPFVFKKGEPKADQKANATEIEAEWNAVKKHQEWVKGKLANFEVFTKLRLDNTYINALAMTKLRKMERELLSCPSYKDFQHWPADAQLGLLSMAWALGMPKLKTGWPDFRAACEKQDFTTAASECHILTVDNPGVIPRNTHNKRLFNNAAAVLAHDGKNAASNKIMRMTLHFPFVLPQPTRSKGKLLAV